MSKQTTARHDEGEEYVAIKLFRDNDRYKDDVFVAVNGERCQIQRGVRTMIKRKFLWAIQNQMRQDAAYADYIRQLQTDFEDATRANRI